MKQQGFGKDDLKPRVAQEDIIVNEELADKIIRDVLIGVASEISVQAGLPVDHQEENPEMSDHEFLTTLLGALRTVGVQLELSDVDMTDEEPLMSVTVKQTVGQIDLSEAVTKKEDK